MNNYEYDRVYQCISKKKFNDIWYGINHKEHDMIIYRNYNMMYGYQYKIRLNISDVQYFSITIDEYKLDNNKLYDLINNIITFINLKLHDKNIVMGLCVKNIKLKFKYNKKSKNYKDINLLIHHFILHKRILENERKKQDEEKEIENILKVSEEEYKKEKENKEQEKIKEDQIENDVIELAKKISKEEYEKDIEKDIYKEDNKKVEKEVLELAKKLSEEEYKKEKDFEKEFEEERDEEFQKILKKSEEYYKNIVIDIVKYEEGDYNPFILEEGDIVQDYNYDNGNNDPFCIKEEHNLMQQVEGY